MIQFSFPHFTGEESETQGNKAISRSVTKLELEPKYLIQSPLLLLLHQDVSTKECFKY